MSGAVGQEPRTLSAVPGRVRLNLPAWSGRGYHELERHLRQIPGVRRAEANPLTQNVLIYFDPQTTNPQALRSALGSAQNLAEQAPAEEPPTPSVIEEWPNGRIRRARIAVRVAPGLTIATRSLETFRVS